MKSLNIIKINMFSSEHSQLIENGNISEFDEYIKYPKVSKLHSLKRKKIRLGVPV